MRNEVGPPSAGHRCPRATVPSLLLSLTRGVARGVARRVAGAAPLSVTLLAIGLVLAMISMAAPPGPGGAVQVVRPVALLNPLTGVAGGPGNGSGSGGPAPKPKGVSSPSSDSGSSGGSAAPKPDKAKQASGSSDSAPQPKPAAKPDTAPSGGGAAAQHPTPNKAEAPADGTSPPVPHPGAPPSAARNGVPAQPDAGAAPPKPAPPNAAPADQRAAAPPRPPPPVTQGVPPLTQPPGGPPRPIPAAQTAAAQGPCDGKGAACATGPTPTVPANSTTTAADAQQQLLCGSAGTACPAPRPAQASGSAANGAIAPATLRQAGHTALDAAGMVPVVQEVANGVNAVWYATEGDWANAGISAAGIIPIAGDAAVGTRLALDGAKFVKGMRTADTAGKTAEEAGEGAAQLVKDAKLSEPAAAQGRPVTNGGNPTPPPGGPAPPGGGSGDNLHSPNFVVHPNGETIPVPDGAVGPTPADNGAGMQFQGGSGGHGLDPRTSGVRVMDPTTKGKYPYPDGYLKYNNKIGQAVNPNTGQTVPRSDPWAHWQWGPR
jgi:hypothetical protein